MVRPTKCRVIQNHPIADIYKPRGIPACNLKMVNLSIEGFEALRLADVEGMEHIEAAKLMEISRPTFSRLLIEAHKIVSTALINGWGLCIQGGNFIKMEDLRMQENKKGCGNGYRQGQGRGQCCGLNMGKNPKFKNADLAITNQEREMDKMKTIVVSSIGKDLSAKVDPRFGRSNNFLIIDPLTMEFSHIDNSKVNEMGSGAGIQTAEMISKTGAKIVLTGSVGPKAGVALSASGIKFIEGFDNMSVMEAVNKYKMENK